MSAGGKFGDYGGQYVPEALMPVIEELTDAHKQYVLDNEDDFMDDFRARLWDFGGRPTPLQRADRLSERYNREVCLKRGDLLHGGTHKLNNTLGQILLAEYAGEERIIAETGASRRGTATTMACTYLNMPYEICVGECDINRQRPNVFRMKLNSPKVNPVTVGRGTLKEVISETMRDWTVNVEDTHYVIDSIVGPYPFPNMVRGFQSVISEEARTQVREKLDRLPSTVVAYASGGSNTTDAFAEFIDDEETALYTAEAGGSTLEVDEETGVAPNSASLTTGSEGILHGAHTRLLQDRDGQIMKSHSVSSGLDYAGVDPELVHLVDTSYVAAVNVDDGAALTAFHRLSQMGGIILAPESAHAFGYLESVVGPDALDVESAGDLDEYVMVNVSGRSGKDPESATEETYEHDIDIALNIDEFTGGL